MKYTEFVNLIKHRLIYKYNSNYKDLGLMPWDYLKLVKLGTKRIDYNCDFKNGKCFVMHKSSISKRFDSGMCCCKNCFNNVGYLGYLQLDNKADMKLLARKFIKPKNIKKLQANGFWRIKTGCSLPRTLRSLTCLSYMCNSTKEPELDTFYILRILNSGESSKSQLELVKFVKKELNGRLLQFENISSTDKEFLIDIIWRFAKQKFAESHFKRIESSSLG